MRLIENSDEGLVSYYVRNILLLIIRVFYTLKNTFYNKKLNLWTKLKFSGTNNILLTCSSKR